MSSTQQDVQVAPELEPLNLADKPTGPGAAMMVAAGFGILVLGVLTTIPEASEDFKLWLQDWEWGQGVGPLAGKTTIASIFYFGCLASMWFIWRKKDINLKHAFYAGLAMGILGAIGTFPTFFQLFTTG
jgi:fluoride ion exporter CrcB/FEX